MMSVREIKSAFEQLEPSEREELSRWFVDQLEADADKRLEEEVLAGRFDEMADQAVADFKAGRCKPL